MGLGELGVRGWEVGIDWCARVGGFGPKSENRAAGAQFSRTNRGGACSWVVGTYMGPGKLGVRGWEVGIDWRARVGGFGPKSENRATGARFSRTNRGGACSWVVGTYMWPGKLGVRGWEVGIDWCARVGGFGTKSENRATGARFSRTNRGGACSWVVGTYMWPGKLGVRGWEVGIDWCARVGGFGPKSENRATGARFSRTNRGGACSRVVVTYMCPGKLGVRGWEVGIDWCARVGGFGPKSENRATGARFSRTNRGGACSWVVGTYMWPGKLGVRGWEVGIDWCAR